MTIPVFLYKFRSKIIVLGSALLLSLILSLIGFAAHEMILIGFGGALFGIVVGNVIGEILQYRFSKRKLKKGD